MASVTGSFLVFDRPVGDTRPFNLVLTPDGTGATTVAGSYNIEVFTSVAGTPGAGFDAAAFVTGAVQAVNPVTLALIPNEIRAGTPNATEQLLATTLNTGVKFTDVTGGETIQGGSGSNETIVGASGDTLLGGSGAGQVLNALAGNDSVVAGSGTTVVFGAVGDTVVMGASTYVDITSGKMRVTTGATGTNLITGGAGESGPNTISGSGAATVTIQSLGQGDIVDLSKSSGAASVNASIGKDSVSAGSGATNVYGGVGDTINAGAATYVDGSAGGMTITLGATGADTVFGTGTSTGDTITGTGAATLSYNPGGTGGTGNVIDLSKSSGGGVINSFSTGGKQITAPGDTISVGTGATSVWGGGGDRIGVGNASSAGGTALFDHSTTIAGAKIGFGTNDTVQAVTYGSTPGAVTVGAGASTAKDSVTTFNSTTDTIFYASRGAKNQDAAIIATASTSGTNTTIVLPDGTVLTLVGVTSTAGLTFTS